MTKSSTGNDVETIAALREPARLALYQYVGRQPGAVSRDQAAEALGLTRPLAAFHLDRLVEVGLLTADYRRLSGRSGPGAGRPAKLYRRSRRRVALSLPYRNHALLAELLAAGMAEGGPEPDVAGPAHETGRSLGSRARRRLRSRVTQGRLADCVASVLESLGFEPYRAPGGELLARNCPFDPISRRFRPVVCGVGQALVGGIIDGVGADGLDVTREDHPDRCCVVVGSRDPSS